jgi:hypothetical protein
MKKILSLFFISFLMIGLITSCGGDDHADDVRSMTGHTLVDPYVIGAKMFEDKNDNGVQDLGEQESTATDADGIFSFASALTIGSVLRIIPTEEGTHNGYPFTGGLTREVDTTEGYLAVSPFTTLITNGWTSQNILDVLYEAGVSGIIEEDLKKDPMGTFNLTDTVDSITDSKLERIRSTIAIYNFMSVINELISNQYELSYEQFTSHPEWKTLLKNMVEQVKAGLSKSTMEQIQSKIDAAKSQCPFTVADVTIEDIIKGSVAIANYVIDKTVDSCKTSNDKNGDGYPDCDYNAYTQASSDFAEWKDGLGRRFYVIRTKTNTCTIEGVQRGLLPNVLGNTSCKLEGTNATIVCN